MTPSEIARNDRGLALTYYGDDFTGSVDVMEALIHAGLRTVLFLDAPTIEELARYPHLDAVGVAGIARTMSPTEMNSELLQVLISLRDLGAPIFHYKVCSTFDSSPAIGSIGKAAELVDVVFGPTWIPLVVGAPILKRYCLFGQLFAERAGRVYRLDRHPTMSAHPVTPMDESDLLAHLGKQTDAELRLVDFLLLLQPRPIVDDLINDAADGAKLVLFDNFDERTELALGRQLAREVKRRWLTMGETTPIIGSSGVEYALARQWSPTGHSAPVTSIESAPQTFVVAGSRARATDLQVEYAINHGFESVSVDPVAITGAEARLAIDRVARETVSALRTGNSVVLHTPPKASDVHVDGTELAKALGQVVARVVVQHQVPRMIVAGGDTSGMVAKALGIRSLEIVASFDPGAPLCRAGAETSVSDGMEICLKSGQIGGEDYFVRISESGRYENQ